MQKRVAERAGWKRQEFNFELSYYLNFYYPLIFGGFDHIALIVNHCLGLGLPEKNVGAAYKGFPDALQAKNAKEELDAEIAEAGADIVYRFMPSMWHLGCCIQARIS
jgi:hypothetical protein